MTFSKGGTITLGGKTYNISQINSVYIGNVKRHSGIGIFFMWFIVGVVISIIIIGILNVIGSALGGALWIIASAAALIGAISLANIEDYAVFFDMSSGKVTAYSDQDRKKVEEIKNDIIKGLQEGYFPNYLQG